MILENAGMSSSFCRWQALTDQFAMQLGALERREDGAAAALRETTVEIEQCRLEVQAHGAMQ